MVAGLCWILLFLFVPETFWERTPHPHHRQVSRKSSASGFSIFRRRVSTLPSNDVPSQVDGGPGPAVTEDLTPRKMSRHVGFAASPSSDRVAEPSTAAQPTDSTSTTHEAAPAINSYEPGMKSQTNSRPHDLMTDEIRSAIRSWPPPSSIPTRGYVASSLTPTPRSSFPEWRCSTNADASYHKFSLLR